MLATSELTDFSGLRFRVFWNGHIFLRVGGGGYAPPPVFSARVANKGLKLDAASRQGRRQAAESSRLKGERRGGEKDNARMQRARKRSGEDGIVERKWSVEFKYYGSTIVTICQ